MKARRHPDIAAALGPVRDHVRQASSGAGDDMRVLVACSGGADSMALLGLLLALRRSEGLELGVGHVHHGLREASDEEAEMVRRQCERADVPVFFRRLQLDADAPSLPERARNARRAALVDQARDFGCGCIALGHTATDQAETMLMHATRGAGLRGLAAMAPVEPETDGVTWVRPLLGFTRDRVRALAGLLGMQFVDDPSNEDRSQFRVQLRHDVLTVLREQNPRFEEAFAALALQARDAGDAVGRWASRECVARRRGPHSWDLEGFDALPRGVRRQAVRDMCLAGGAEASELGFTVVTEIEAAAVIAARARAGEVEPAGGVAPRRWDLRRRRTVRVDKRSLDVLVTRAGRGANDP